jgi:hypothetical protein
MPSKKWASEAEENYLVLFEEQYLAAQTSGRYHSFWPQLMEGWFKNFPEIEKIFPDKTVEDLTEEEVNTLATMIDARRKVNFAYLKCI